MKRTALVLAIASLLPTGPPASAEMCALDAVPAATLLLPYFEVDLDAVPEVTTVFTVHNAFDTATIAHVSIWTDWSQPVLDFDIFLTGYDAQSVDLRDMLIDGNLPVTADLQGDLATSPNAAGRAADPTSSCDGTDDSCSPHGRPSWDASFDAGAISVPGVEDCIDIFPFFINPLLTGSRLQSVRDKLTGQPNFGTCYGADHGDNRARGYVTIDNADACSLIFPSDPGYFGDGVEPGVASNVNQLWGDWSLIDSQNLLTYAVDPLIHIEADDAFDSSSTPTNYTFYGRYTQAEGGIDNREPLGSAWSFSYFNSGPELVTDLIVWRDSTADNQDSGGYACGSGPDWQPLDQTQVVCFDQIENAVEICGEAPCFPLESQRLELGSGDLAVPYTAGWCYLNLNISGTDDPTGDVDFPPPAGDVAQSWVGAGARRGSVVSGGLNAALQAHACQDVNPVIDVGPPARGADGAGVKP